MASIIFTKDESPTPITTDSLLPDASVTYHAQALDDEDVPVGDPFDLVVSVGSVSGIVFTKNSSETPITEDEITPGNSPVYHAQAVDSEDNLLGDAQDLEITVLADISEEEQALIDDGVILTDDQKVALEILDKRDWYFLNNPTLPEGAPTYIVNGNEVTPNNQPV